MKRYIVARRYGIEMLGTVENQIKTYYPDLHIVTVVTANIIIVETNDQVIKNLIQTFQSSLIIEPEVYHYTQK